MATNTIIASAFTNCDEIHYFNVIDYDISQVWFNEVKIWEATSGTPTDEWIVFPTGQTVAAAFTPSQDVYLTSASMILNSTQSFNFLNGVWRIDGSNGTAIEVHTDQPIAPVNVGTLGSYTKWLHSYVFDGTTILSAGVKYMIHLGYNYFDVQYLNGSNVPYWAANWSWAGSSTAALTSAATSGIYLSVTTTPVG